ncbi:MAG: peptide-methionine (R)-S-oxide reductase MsrB [Reyranella sp.]|nr:peptide-methionine (R)-S-oxide reductase MsrB [Reyranella sp.]
MIRPNRRQFTLAGTILAAAGLASPGARAEVFEVVRSDEEWRRLLTPTQYSVLRQAQTERPGSSPLDREKRAGTYHCAGCELALFASTTKFDSGTGWPSFWQPLEGAIATRSETFLFMKQTEVHCRRCGGHLGHVFNDGPKPTGLRYCMNGVAMAFKPTAAGS